MKMNQSKIISTANAMRKQTHTCVLTVSLLVSNHIDTIAKCMESIKPLLEQVSSELIVVDTVGEDNSDGSLAVAKKYADKVVHFDWCDDFSAARNAGLQCANGEWYLYLDDDEWFDDVAPFIDFFKDENKRNRYNSLYYIQRNYTSADGQKYEDVNACRCSRIFIDSAFHGRVHESLQPLYHPSITIDAFVHHYGYLNERRGEKLKRNEPLLQRELDENSYNFHAWDQYVAGKAVDAVQEAKAAERALQNWLQCKEAKTKHEYICHGARYLEFLIGSYVEQSAWKYAEAAYQKYIGQVCLNQYDHCVLGIRMADAYSHLDNEAARVQALKEYLVNYAWLQEHEQEYIEQFSVYFQSIVSEDNECYCLKTLLSLQQKAQEWEGILQDFKTIHWKKNADFIDQYLPKAVNAAFRVDDSSSLEEICENLRDADGHLPMTFGISGNLLKNENDIDAAAVTDFFAKMHSEDSYILLQKALTAENTDAFSLALNRLYQRKVTCQIPCEELLPLLLRNSVDPTPFIETLNYENWLAVINAVSEQISLNPQSIPELIGQIEAVFPDSQKKQILLISLQHNYICEESIPFDNIMKQLPQYVENVMRYSRSYYAQELFSDVPSLMLPSETRFGFYMQKAFYEKNTGNAEGYLANLRAALNVYPAMGMLIKRLLDAFKQEQKQADEAGLQMQQLAEAVKLQIKKLIQNGMAEQAAPLVQQLAQLLPNDKEVDQLQAMCKR